MISLGPMVHLDSKEKGDNSMSFNRLSCLGVWGEESVDPRDMAKATPASSRISRWCNYTPTGKTSETGASSLRQVRRSPVATSGAGRCPVRTFKEMSRPPKSR